MKKYLSFVSLLAISLHSFGQNPGNALKFDGVNDKVECPLPSAFFGISANNFTIEFWTKVQAFSFSRMVFAQFDVLNFVSVGSSASNTILFHVNSSGVSYSHETGAVIPSGQWMHIAARWIASSHTTELLINGTPVASASTNGTSAGVGSLMAVGNKAGASQFYNGEIDELRVWNVARTDCEIAANMNAELTGSEPSLVAYYKFNAGIAGGTNTADTLAADQVSGTSGILYGFALAGNTSNWIVSGADITASGLQGKVNTTVTMNAGTLTASATGAAYQWLDCTNGYASIPGATSQSFTPSVSGAYSVEVSKNNCSDTSDCVSVSGTNEIESALFTCYPNPARDVLYIKRNSQDAVSVQIKDLSGKIITERYFDVATTLEIPVSAKTGIYTVQVQSQYSSRSFRILITAERP